MGIKEQVLDNLVGGDDVVIQVKTRTVTVEDKNRFIFDLVSECHLIHMKTTSDIRVFLVEYDNNYWFCSSYYKDELNCLDIFEIASDDLQREIDWIENQIK